MSVTGPRFDTDRFGLTLPRFTPRQSEIGLAIILANFAQRRIVNADEIGLLRW